jgi:hypothetical protein
MGWDGGGWIDLAQNRDMWTVLVNTVINSQIPKNCWRVIE